MVNKKNQILISYKNTIVEDTLIKTLLNKRHENLNNISWLNFVFSYKPTTYVSIYLKTFPKINNFKPQLSNAQDSSTLLSKIQENHKTHIVYAYKYNDTIMHY